MAYLRLSLYHILVFTITFSDFYDTVGNRQAQEDENYGTMDCVVFSGNSIELDNDEGIMHSVPNLFSFKGALGQLPYFFAGVAAYRFAVDLYRLSVKWLLWIMALLGIVLIQVVWFYPGEYASMSRIIYPITLIPTLFLLLALKWNNRFFTWIGGYAYSIYLFHGFGTSGGRILLKMVGIKAVMLLFIFATCIATACPIVIDILISRFKWGRKLLLGKN